MSGDSTLRDELARERTALANERTLLSYARTSLGFAGLSVFIFKFTDPVIALVAGPLSLTAAFLVFFWGVQSFSRVANQIQRSPSPITFFWHTFIARTAKLLRREP